MQTIRSFTPRNETERLRAIGPLTGIPPVAQRAFTPGSAFAPMSAPGPHDWLATHREDGQPFEQFHQIAQSPPRGRTLYLQPLGDFTTDQARLVRRLADFVKAYYPVPVRLLPPVPVDTRRLTNRINRETHSRQILTTDVFRLLQESWPANAFCVVGVTLEDLYPAPAWNYVFGQAMLAGPRSVGIYSLARLDPAFLGGILPPDHGEQFLRRSLKLVSHEIGHIFGLPHCIYFRCNMNGSNNREELDRQPLHLCPVCLRKLHYVLGFNIAGYYAGLLAQYRSLGLREETDWTTKRLRVIRG